ncbi:MAG: helix-turn-helix domain-containing protein [Cellulophaga sp.]
MNVIEITKKRVFRIQQMLLEMSSGNFFYHLEHLGNNDSVEGIEMALNMLSEELQECLSHGLYTSTKGTTKHLVQMSFLLDTNGIVQMISKKTCILLGIPYQDIVGKPFETFLNEDSKKKWYESFQGLKQETLFETSIDLDIKTNEELIIPNSCHITTLKGEAEIERQTLVTVIFHSKVRYEMEKDLKNRVMELGNDPTSKTSEKPKKRNLILSSGDIKKLTKAYDIIVNNPEKNLPNLKKFALQLGTNEFKLKYGFKELYGTSVHQFLINERLRKVVILVQFSDLSLNHIAQLSGYKSYPHFSRTFKKRYGYSPNSLRKRSLENRTDDILRITSVTL